MKQGWKYKKLGEVCVSDLGKTLNSSKDKGELRPYLCAVNVLWDKIDLSTLKETRFEEDELERYSVKKGDLLVCEGGDVGRAAIWNDEAVIQYQNALHRIRFNGEVIPRFCLFYLRHLKDNGTLDGRYAKGVTIKHLVKSSLLSIPIPVPSTEEQKAICSLLDKLNLVIEKKKEQVAELDKLVQSLFYEMFGDPVTNEKGWANRPFEECLQTVKYTTKIKSNDFLKHGVFPIISQEEEYISGFWNDETDVFKVSSPVVIFGDHTRVLKYVNFDFVLGADGVKILLPISDIDAWYLFHFLKAYKIPSLGYSRHYKLLKDINLLLPPLPLQQAFAEKVKAIEQQKELINQSIKDVQTLFDAKMDYYFGD